MERSRQSSRWSTAQLLRSIEQSQLSESRNNRRITAEGRRSVIAEMGQLPGSRHRSSRPGDFLLDRSRADSLEDIVPRTTTPTSTNSSLQRRSLSSQFRNESSSRRTPVLSRSNSSQDRGKSQLVDKSSVKATEEEEDGDGYRVFESSASSSNSEENNGARFFDSETSSDVDEHPVYGYHRTEDRSERRFFGLRKSLRSSSSCKRKTTSSPTNITTTTTTTTTMQSLTQHKPIGGSSRSSRSTSTSTAAAASSDASRSQRTRPTAAAYREMADYEELVGFQLEPSSSHSHSFRNKNSNSNSNSLYTSRNVVTSSLRNQSPRRSVESSGDAPYRLGRSNSNNSSSSRSAFVGALGQRRLRSIEDTPSPSSSSSSSSSFRRRSNSPDTLQNDSSLLHTSSPLLGQSRRAFSRSSAAAAASVPSASSSSFSSPSSSSPSSTSASSSSNGPLSLFAAALETNSGASLRGRGEASGIPSLDLNWEYHRPRLMAEGLAKVLVALERIENDEDLMHEQLLMLEASMLFGGLSLQDQHRDLRLDVDNMSYEELLALGESIGSVSTGLEKSFVIRHLKKMRFSHQSKLVCSRSPEDDGEFKCSICQEEYREGEEVGVIECGHKYHFGCIGEWLGHKNVCPICKSPALAAASPLSS